MASTQILPTSITNGLTIGHPIPVARNPITRSKMTYAGPHRGFPIARFDSHQIITMAPQYNTNTTPLLRRHRATIPHLVIMHLGSFRGPWSCRFAGRLSSHAFLGGQYAWCGISPIRPPPYDLRPRTYDLLFPRAYSFGNLAMASSLPIRTRTSPARTALVGPGALITVWLEVAVPSGAVCSVVRRMATTSTL